jgi:hypothetical protein
MRSGYGRSSFQRIISQQMLAEQLVTGLGGEGKRLGIKDALETFGLLHL